MASIPHVEPPIYVEDFHRGDHHHYDLSDTSAVERRPTAGRETWINIAAIPAAPPAPAPYPGGGVVGDARGVQGVPLTQVPGNPYRYAYQGPPPQQFAEMVPANYGGGAYKPTLRDSGGQTVPYNPSVWVADGLLSVVEFKYRTPQELGYAPPFTLDYWRYVGPVVSTSGTLANDGTGAQVYEVGSSNPSLLRTLVADPGAGLGGIVITQNPTEIAIGNSLTGNNLNPAGINVGRSFAQKTATQLDFRTLEAGTDVTITETASKIIISAIPGAGGLSGLNNEGTGFDVYDVPVGTTALLRRLNPGAGGISIAYAGVSGVNAYLDIDNTLTGANVGGGAGVFRDKTAAPALLNFRSFIAAASSGLTLTQNADDITISATAGTVVTALANEGAGTGLIFDAVVGNTANLRSLLIDPTVGNEGIAISTVGTEVRVGNTMTGANVGAGTGTLFSAKTAAGVLQFNTLAGTANGLTVSAPAANVITIDNTLTGASLGGTAAVFANKTGATLNFRGITAGTGITVTQNANDITITNADGASTVTLASAGGTETLVNDGVGPALATKGLSAGTGGISLTGAAASVTIDNTLTGNNLSATGGRVDVYTGKTVGPALLNFRSLYAGANVLITANVPGAGDITIAAGVVPPATPGTVWVVQDVKAPGVNAGNFTPPLAWIVRVLNTITSFGPAPANVTLAANQLTFQPGVYAIRGNAPAYGSQVQTHQSRLWSVTGAVTLLEGGSMALNVNAANLSLFQGILNIGGVTVVELQHQRTGGGVATNGFGLAAGVGINEVYASLEIMQLA